MRRKTFENHVDNRKYTTDDDIELNRHKQEIDIDEIIAQNGDAEFSKEIFEEEKTISVLRIKEFDFDKIRAQKDEVEISNEIVKERKSVDVPRMGLLSWIGGIVLFFLALGFIFSIGGLMIHWLLLIASIVFIIDMISGESRREI